MGEAMWSKGGASTRSLNGWRERIMEIMTFEFIATRSVGNDPLLRVEG